MRGYKTQIMDTDKHEEVVNISPLISVIVPVYNVEKYLSRCIDSILNQTFSSFELILVDDGSQDKGGEICDEYANKDPRIRVIHQENKGLSAARNAGLDLIFNDSESSWISFIDSDDWVHEKYLELLYKAVHDNGVELSVCEFKTTGESLQVNTSCNSSEVMDSEQFYINSDQGTRNVAWGKLYKKNLFINIRYPVGRIYEDAFTTHKLIFGTDRIATVKLPLYFYFQNSNGIMHRPFTLQNYDGINAREERIGFFHDHGFAFLEKQERAATVYEIALFAIASRKEKIYDQVPAKYKVGWIKAMIEVKKYLNENQYESVMVQYYPRWIKLRSYAKKLLSMI